MKLGSHVLLALVLVSLFSCATMGQMYDCGKAARDSGKDILVRLGYWMKSNACEYESSTEAEAALMQWFDGQVDIVCYAYGRCMKDITKGQEYWRDWYYQKNWVKQRPGIEKMLVSKMPEYRAEHCN